jgi:hypothetical protein
MFTFTIARTGDTRILRISALLTHFPGKRYEVRSYQDHLKLLPVESGRGYAKTTYGKKGSLMIPVPKEGFPPTGFYVGTVQATLDRDTGDIVLPIPEHWTERQPRGPFKKRSSTSSKQRAANGLSLEHIREAVTLLNSSRELKLTLDEEGKLHATIEL